MRLDFRAPETATVFAADVAIIGAGPAGITLALGLRQSGLRVLLLEGGGTEFESETQALYEGESVGRQIADPVTCRLRYLGGTSNHWEGWCARLHEQDFSSRPWLDIDGWPLDHQALSADYEHAEKLCELSGPDQTEIAGVFADSDLRGGLFRFSPPTRFGTRYLAELEASENVTLLLHANAVGFNLFPGASRVRSVSIASLNGRAGAVQARAVVLACGGMENARLLLQPSDAAPQGIGNEADQVGRCFMQHIEVDAGRLLSADGSALLEAFSYSDNARPYVHLSAEIEERRRLARCGFAAAPSVPKGEAYRAARNLWSDLQNGHWPDELGEDLLTVLSDLGGLIGDLEGHGDKTEPLRMSAWAEQMPNPSSRVTLIDERDVFGLKKLRVDWRLSQNDKRALRDSCLAFGEVLGANGLARMQLADWLARDDDTWPDRIWSGCHHMGTTRMSADPRSGVVDGHCRVHSVENLFVAGSSVFPTGGFVMPTLTIVALANRLARHIEQEFG